jgi:hypothetical protein
MIVAIKRLKDFSMLLLAASHATVESPLASPEEIAESLRNFPVDEEYVSLFASANNEAALLHSLTMGELFAPEDLPNGADAPDNVLKEFGSREHELMVAIRRKAALHSLCEALDLVFDTDFYSR